MNSTNVSDKETSKRGKWHWLFQQRRRPHDPLLVFNMSVFNYDSAWNRVFISLKDRENVWA